MAMVESNKRDREKIITIIISIILIVICVVAFAYLILFQNTENGEKPTIAYTTEFEFITADEAYNLINNSEKIDIIDVRGCKCSYRNAHIPTANWSLNPNEYINSTIDIIVYDSYGYNETFGNGDSIDFCHDLLHNVYGKVYCIAEGYMSWDKKGYPFVTGDEPGIFE